MLGMSCKKWKDPLKGTTPQKGHLPEELRVKGPVGQRLLRWHQQASLWIHRAHALCLTETVQRHFSPQGKRLSLRTVFITSQRELLKNSSAGAKE
ncbi:hypothetical protein FKM82_024689 [Ascaphus truei]